MPQRTKSISIVAGRIGLYHFLLLNSLILLDTDFSHRKCHPSAIGAIAQLVEAPATFIDCWRWPLVTDSTLQAYIAIGHVLWIVCVNSICYGGVTALVLHTIRRYRS